MTELLFVRHGEAVTNLDLSRISGRSNHAPLTDNGKHQARRLGEYLRKRNYAPDAIFSSGALRADTTAEFAVNAATYLLPINVDERLQEVSQGEFEGQLRDEVYSESAIKKHALDTLEGKLPGTESLADAHQRMFDFTQEATSHYPDGHLLVFSHGLAIRSLAGIISHYSKSQILATSTPNVSITSITMTDGVPTVHDIGKNVIWG